LELYYDARTLAHRPKTLYALAPVHSLTLSVQVLDEAYL